MSFYHFTSTHHLPQILEDSVIKTTDSNVSLVAPSVGPSVVWLLSEKTPTHGHGLVSHVDKTAVRIEVDVPAIKWLDWAPACDPKFTHSRELLIRAGGGLEAAEMWYVFPAPIRESQWLSITALREVETVREIMSRKKKSL